MDQQDLKGPEAPTETFAAPDRLRAEALSRQLQNLLLLQPLFHLEANKGRLGGEQHALFEGIDTLFLSLSLFDFISERMVMDLGARRQEIVTHLSDEIASMEAALAHDERGRSNSSLEQCQAMAGAVLDTLANARNRHRLFELSYFDPQRVTDSTLHGGGMRHRAFRLLRLTDQPDGILRYLLTPEGITAYLSMLDVDINARFLDLQARGFHATESKAVADPEAQILVQLLELPSARLSPIADAITSLMNRPKITHCSIP